MVLGTTGLYYFPFGLNAERSNPVMAADPESLFYSPPATAGPWALWLWMNGHITREGITLDLALLKRNGFRGAFIYHFNRGVPPGPVKTGSSAWLDLLEFATREAERLGLEIVLQFPENLVGNQVTLLPENQLRSIAWSITKVTSSGRVKAKLPLPKADSGIYRDFKVLAFPGDSGETDPESVIDLTPLMKKNGSLTWNTPSPGNWTIIRAGWKTKGPVPVVDLMSEDSLRLLTDNLNTNLLPRLPGKSFRGFFTTDTFYPMGIWSQADQEYFTRETPFLHLSWLPYLFPYTLMNPGQADRFRHDYRIFRKEKLEKHFFSGMGEWCRQKGLGWYVLPDKTINGEPVTFWSTQRGMGTPVSAPHESGAAVANVLYQGHDSPAYTGVIAGSLFLSGWNQLIISPFTHQPYQTGLPGMSPGYPGFAAGRNNPWSEHTAELVRYLSRTGYMLQQGRGVTDFVIFTGDLQDDTFLIESSYLDKNYSLGHLDPDELTLLSCRDGITSHPGGHQFQVCVLVPGIQLYAASLIKLAELTRAGMTLLVIHQPEIRLTLSDDETAISLLTEELFGQWDGKTALSREFGKGRVVYGQTAGDLLSALKLEPDLVITATAGPAPDLSFVHRISAENHIYYLRNNTGGHARVNGSFRTGELRPELWVPETGDVFAAPIFEVKKGRCILPLELPANSSIFVVFREKAGNPYLKKITLEGRQFWSGIPLPANRPARVAPGNEEQAAVDPGPAMAVPFTFRTDKEGNLLAVFVQNGDYDFEVYNEDVGEHMAIYVKNCFSVPLEVAWKIRFPENSGAPAFIEPEKLESLSLNREFNIRHFSGICQYETVFYLTDSDFITGRKFLLDLGAVSVSARVYLNGKEAGLAWRHPFTADVTPWAKKGENQLMVEVAVPWINRLIGDEQLPEENVFNPDKYIAALPDWYVNNRPKTGERKTFLVSKVVNGSDKLRESGLMGPVKLIFAEERYL